MSFAELVEALKQFRAYIVDLPTFVFRPTVYMRAVSQEPFERTLIRAAIYMLGAVLLQITILGSVARSLSISLWALPGVAILDASIGLAYLPCLLACAYALKAAKPLRMAVVYLLAYRVVYLTFPLVAYAFFVTTENYSWAAIRGALTYVYIAGAMLVFPFAMAHTVKQRALGTLVSIASGIILLFAYSALFDSVPSPGKRTAFSMAYDPIGSEIDRAEPAIRVNEGDFLRKTFEEISTLVRGKDSVTPNSPAEVQARIGLLQARWPQDYARLLAQLNSDSSRISQAIDSASFHTTRVILRPYLNAVLEAKLFAASMDQYVTHPSVNNFLAAQTVYIEALTSANKALSPHADYSVVRMRLSSWGLLDISLRPNNRMQLAGRGHRFA